MASRAYYQLAYSERYIHPKLNRRAPSRITARDFERVSDAVAYYDGPLLFPGQAKSLTRANIDRNFAAYKPNSRPRVTFTPAGEDRDVHRSRRTDLQRRSAHRQRSSSLSRSPT